MCIRSCSLRRRARRPWATRAGCSAPSSLGWGLMCAATVTNKRKWLSTKNRSPQRSTPRHPIAMASTAKPLDPMSCALAAVLLPESRAHGCHVQKPLFPGPTPHVRGAYVLGPCLRAGCAQAAWAGGGSRSDALGAGRRCLAPRVGGGRWSGPARGGARLGGGASAWARGGPGDTVSSRGAESGMRGRLGWCGVRWLFQGCCSGDSLGPWTDAT